MKEVIGKFWVIGENQNFRITFWRENNAFCENRKGRAWHDVPLLQIDASNLSGIPTRDGALSADYNTKVFEVVKGLKHGQRGAVAVDVSLNGGMDFPSSDTLFWYYPKIEVIEISPTQGPLCGNM